MPRSQAPVLAWKWLKAVLFRGLFSGVAITRQPLGTKTTLIVQKSLE